MWNLEKEWAIRDLQEVSNRLQQALAESRRKAFTSNQIAELLTIKAKIDAIVIDRLS